jgi:NADPH:quinone reductase-like Zn-dependent oxidoreductase
VLGFDVAGVVEAVGDGVEGVAVGDEVLGISRAALAEHAVVPVAKLVPKPASLSFVEAAALPISGLTALQAVRHHGEVQAGQRVLVMGASGGVGTYAVQIAAVDGAEVTGVAGTSKLDLVRTLGARHVVDHRTNDPLDGTVRYDVIIDTGGHRRLRDLRRALTPKGRLVIVGSETDGAWVGGLDRQLRALLWSPFVGPRLGTFVSSENATDLAELAALADAGRVRPAIDRTWPLAEAAAAIDHVDQGRARGKVVVTVGP